MHNEGMYITKVKTIVFLTKEAKRDFFFFFVNIFLSCLSSIIGLHVER